MGFYEALEVNDSAVKVLGDDTLRDIARELVRQVRASVSIDWEKKESTRAKLRNMVRTILNKYGYPPDKQKMAVDLVLEQAAELSDVWAVQPSLTDLRTRYMTLLQKRHDHDPTLPEHRELRDLERELVQLGELQLEPSRDLPMAAEHPPD
ncbi:MAG TPA: type I restriction enzyme endonuclease domain-containing protein [Chloroflexota bacterium]|nr:type I restriction enzyme endonuclease domain-containing protein [Chloroflexota bacterium]